MRFTRIIAGTITAGLVGLVPIAVSSPADAAVTVDLASTTTLAVSFGDNPLAYGDDISLEGAVTGSDTLSAYKGTVQLMQLTPANPAWVPVGAPVASSGYLSFSDLKPTTNSAYKLVYSGYAATTTSENNYAASESVPVAVNVFRKLTIKNPRGTFLKGKVAPDYSKGKVQIFKKVGKNYKKFKTLKTDKKGKFNITLPSSRKRTYFRFVVPADANFVASVAEGSTITS